MKKLLPIILAVFGLAGGVGAGGALRPAPEVDPEAHVEPKEKEPVEFVKLNNQFVVPVVEDGRVASLVVLSVSLEVTQGSREIVYQLEPKLRDAFLKQMFDHANIGGFSGTFTAASHMDSLRKALGEVAKTVLGDQVHDVLIIDIVRQDT